MLFRSWQNDGNGSGSTPAGSVDNFYIRELTPVNYFCGFDDPVENAKWRLNNHVSCTNKWVIGSADYNVGPASLYISSDNGVTAGYVNREGWVTAVREFVLEAGESYDVSFDWKCYGENNMDHMYVCWVTDTTLNIGSNANSSLPNWIAPNAKNVLPERADTIQMVRSASWKTGTFKVNGTGKPARLVFFWKNNGSNIYEPGGVIDNVQLTNRCCPAPENLQADLFGTEVTLTWDGDPNGNYEVMYRNAYTDKDAAWNVLTNQTSPCQFTVTEKGR